MTNFEEIDSPLALFNNFMLMIGEQLSEIYDYDLFKNNDIIFDNDSILLFGYIKLTKTGLLIKKQITSTNIQQTTVTVNNYNKLMTIYNRFMVIFNDISNKIDASVTVGYINSIIDDLLLLRNSESTKNKIYFIPHRYKIANEINDNNTLKNLYNKFGYGLTFEYIKSSNSYKYNIIRMISSDLNESKCIANIRPLDIDTVITGKLKAAEITSFLNDLMYYGKITKITRTSID